MSMEDRLAELEDLVESLLDFKAQHIGAGVQSPAYPHPNMVLPYREIHGPTKTSVDSTHDMTFIVDFDTSVSKLFQAKLTVRLAAVRSNVSVAASGGAHGHKMFDYYGGISSALSQAESSVQLKTDHTALAAASITGQDHLHEVPHNSEAISVYTAKKLAGTDINVYMIENASPDDLYTYADSTTHTHSLTYGIYEGSAPSNPNITVTINEVDRTTALGGSWDDDFTVDITTYLRTHDGEPLRQDNTIVISSDELLDVEVVCKSFVSAVSPIYIGTPSF